MNEILKKIFQRIDKKETPQFGIMTIALTFHDGQIRKWDVTTTESHNVTECKPKGISNEN